MIRTMDIRRDPQAPETARRALDELDDVDPKMLDSAKLLTSELVTNSVRHGDGDWIRLVVDTDAGARLRCEVADGGEGFVPRPRTKSMFELGGWGLHLVSRVADRWGVQDGAPRVWFELAA